MDASAQSRLEMVEDPYDPEIPFEYECIDCEERFEPDDVSGHGGEDELIECPDCGGTLRNVSTPSRE